MSVNLFDNVRFLTNRLPVAGTWWGRVRVGVLLAKQDFGGGYWIQGKLNTGIVTNPPHPLFSTVGYQSI